MSDHTKHLYKQKIVLKGVFTTFPLKINSGRIYNTESYLDDINKFYQQERIKKE